MFNLVLGETLNGQILGGWVFVVDVTRGVKGERGRWAVAQRVYPSHFHTGNTSKVLPIVDMGR